jgi:hypothetical protein
VSPEQIGVRTIGHRRERPGDEVSSHHESSRFASLRGGSGAAVPIGKETIAVFFAFAVLATTASATPPRGLPPYLVSVHPLLTNYLTSERSAALAHQSGTATLIEWATTPSDATKPAAAAKLRADASQIADDGKALVNVATVLGKVPVPSAIRRAHSELITSMRSEAAGFATFSSAVLKGSNPTGTIDDWGVGNVRIGRGMKNMLQRVHVGARHWRDAVIAQLHHAGLAVPSWLKQVGT